MSSASDILTKAADIVAGERQKTHGPNRSDIKAIAALWNTHMEHRKAGPLMPVDVCIMMAMLKMARIQCGEPLEDHFCDGAGYLAIGGELSKHD